jgi:Zn-dependent protease
LNSFSQWLSQLQFDGVWQTVVLVAASLLCITFHETCHGLVAYWLGDPTAKNQGRLTLNPIKHVDLAGLIMMAICRFGWAKPVPVDMRNFKNPKSGMAITALAGPVSNVLLAYLAVLFYSFFYYFYEKSGSQVWYVVLVFFSYLEIISAGLAVFNVFPIPPLDGSKVLFSFLPDESYHKLMRYERYGMILLIILLFTDVLNTPLIFLRDGLLSGLEAIGIWPYTALVRLLG